MKFSIKDSHLLKKSLEILNGKLHFLCSVDTVYPQPRTSLGHS